MNISREEKKAEAVSRMKKWGLYAPITLAFEKSNRVAESRPPLGACFFLDEDQQERVRKFEESHDALVYHVIHSYAEFGECENYLYVSDYKEEWEYDHEDMESGQQIVYADNLNEPVFSELGSIGIQLTPAAGLKRVW